MSANGSRWLFPFCPQPPDWRLDWPTLLDQFSWLRNLANCPQDPIYHGEGDVLTHTRMVCESLISLTEWQQLSPAARSTLFAAALLHDVAKPLVTTESESGRISSHGHVRNGARMAREILWHMDETDYQSVPFYYREMIVALVRFSGLPFYLFERDNIARTVISASQVVRCDWLALLEEADARGRECHDQADLLDKIELFRECCREQRCYDQPREFPSDQSRFLYFHKQNRDPDYFAFDDTKFEVVLMSGLPGTGKDSWLQAQLPGWPVVSLDQLRIEMKIPASKNQGAVVQAAKERARIHLRRGESFAWNATNITRSIRKQLIDLFTDYQARIRIIYLEAPFRELLRRNRERADPVPTNLILKLAHRLDIPDLTEAQKVEWTIGRE